MPDDSITYTISLIFDSSEAQDKIPGDYRPFELKGHFGGCEIFFGRPNIVQEACEVVCLVVIRPRREVGLHQRCACPGAHDEQSR